MAFDLSKFDLGTLAKGAAGVALPAILTAALGGGAKGALLAGGVGLSSYLGAKGEKDEEKAREQARKQEGLAAVNQAFPALLEKDQLARRSATGIPLPAALGAPAPQLQATAQAPDSAPAESRTRQIALALSQLPQGSPLAPALNAELQTELASDDPISRADQLRQQELEFRQSQFQRDQQSQQQEQQRIAALRETLPPEEQSLFDIDPKGYAEQLRDQQFPDPLSPGDRYRSVGTDLYDISGESPQLAARGRTTAEPLEQVFNQDTGLSSYVPRSEASGGLVPPKQGISVGTDENGNPIVKIGGSSEGNHASLGRKARNEVETQMVAMTAGMERLDRIQQSYRPEFNEALPRIGFAWDSIKSKAGVNLNPSEEQALGEFSKFRQSSLENVNLTIKEVTGAAMTDGEAKRIRATLPDPGQSILDGDSPVEFKAKMDAAIEKVKMSYARLAYIRRNGLPMENFGGLSLDGMGDVIDQRGQEIEGDLANAGLSGAELDAALAQALQEEFSL